MASINEPREEPPTNVRWLMFSLACGTSWFLYLHRYAWNFIGPKLQQTYQFDNTSSGYVFGLFYFTYAIGQVPSGMAIDFFGPHLFLGTSLILWSISLIGFGLTGSLVGIGGLRLLFGAAQAGCYPGLTKATRVWFPFKTRTTIQGWVATASGRSGGAMSSIILATVLMGWFKLSWQVSIGIMGLAGVAFGLTFLALFRNSPVGHSDVNDAERELIAEGESPRSLTGSLSWKRAIRSRSLLCFTIQQFMDAGSDVAFAFLIGKYFLERHQTTMASAGLLTSLPLWGGALGGIVGGWLNDVVIRKSGNRRWARSGIGFVGKVIGCGMLFVASWQDVAIVAGIALFFAKFFSDWSQPTTWGTCTDMGGKCSATVFSIINTAGTISGILMPIVFGKVLDWNTPLDELGKQMLSKTNWEPLFLLLAAMYLTSGIFWLLIDCTKSLDSNAAEASDPKTPLMNADNR